MSSIEIVSLDKIKANPFRMLKTYPYSEEKLTILMDSIEETGFWEGVIARKSGGEFQLAFGHHRVEAARRLGLESVPLVVRELSDKQMLQYMGRENMEDFTSFSVLLETWEAATNYYLSHLSAIEVKPLEVAKLLGWIRKDIGQTTNENSVRPNPTAMAANGALKLINAGYHTHTDFEGLQITAVRHLVEKSQSLMNKADKNYPPEIAEQKKEQIAVAINKTAELSRKGEVATDEIRDKVDYNKYLLVREADKEAPLFEAYGKQLADSIAKMLNGDAASEKIKKISSFLGQVELEEDEMIIQRLDYELADLSERALTLRKKLSLRPAKILPMQRKQIGA